MHNCMLNPEVLSAVPAWAREFDIKQRKVSEERFWTYGLGTILAAGRLAVKMGLLNYDMDELERWVTESLIPTLRRQISGAYLKGSAVLTEFLNESIDHVLVVEAAARPPGRPDIFMDTFVVTLPKRALLGRLELDTRTLYVNCLALTRWCKDKWLSLDTVLEDLKGSKHYEGQVSYNLGKGVAVFPGGSVKCFKFKGVEGALETQT
jgi:hypothetical protein